MHLKNPIGQTVTMWGKKKKIIGIVRNFNFESLYHGVGPFFFDFTPYSPNTVVKIKAGMEKETLARIGKVFKAFNQATPFEYTFMDETYKALYASEQRLSILSRCFAVIAVIVSCLGLFGLAAFTAQRRRKEISIRKVIGASTGNLAVMLSKDFLMLVLIAVIIAFPIAWWATHNWLQSFAYHTSVGTGIFLLTFMVMIVLTLCTISYQAIKAAVENPVKSLRSE
jgi:ABC-type antimicrobial peptide transport system permease subunit